MSIVRRFIWVAAAVLVLDQASKAAMVRLLADGRHIPLAGQTLGLRLAENTGAAFGILASGGPALIAVTLAAVGAILYYLRHAEKIHPWMAPALALELGGALGNLVDRVRLGHVTDFIWVSFWPTFNVADSAIFIGAVVLCCCLLLAPHGEARARAEEQPAVGRK